MFVDLLKPGIANELGRNPEMLDEMIRQHKAKSPDTSVVVVDEIQKVPALLDVVQSQLFKAEKQRNKSTLCAYRQQSAQASASRTKFAWRENWMENLWTSYLHRSQKRSQNYSIITRISAVGRATGRYLKASKKNLSLDAT